MTSGRSDTLTKTWTVTVPTRGDADGIAHPIHDCGLFSLGEAEGFVSMLPDLLSDPEARWLSIAEGGRIVGAAYLSLERMSEDVWNLWFIGLARAVRGRGGGSALLAAAERTAKGEGGRLLLVETSSGEALEGARAFYAARGYDREGAIRDYYAPGEDKVIFRKGL